MRRLTMKLAIAGLVVGPLAGIAATHAASAATGPEGCVVQGPNGQGAVGSAVGTVSTNQPSQPGPTCAYEATTSFGWAVQGTVTAIYGTGTLVSGACNWGTNPTTTVKLTGSSASDAPNAFPDGAAGDCVAVSG
jgi:hypothetical protein